MDFIANHSIIQWIGLSSRNSVKSCGYCKKLDQDESDSPDDDEIDDPNEKKSVCLGFYNQSEITGVWAFQLTTAQYQKAIDMNFRRSGRYLYKPVMEKTCCPLYTIRLDALNFKLSRSQKRILRIWNDFLRYDKRPPVKGDVRVHEHLSNQSICTKKKSATAPVPEKNRERKKKFIRKNRAIQRMKNKGIDIEQYQIERKRKEDERNRTLESYLLPWDETFKHKLEIRTVRVGSQEFKDSVDESFAVYEKYQQVVHHDNRCSRRGYQSFLVDNPFLPSNGTTEDGLPKEGSYHIQYLIDGLIVAVGVVDLLPHCLSSAYFYYNWDFAFLNLGTYSALREIEFVRKIAQQRPECHYYYMGYYVHSCRKMKYKGGFKPSELLCDQSHEWVPLPECIEMIENNGGKFTIFRPLSPPAQTGNVWQCKPLRYNSTGSAGTFEKLKMDAELADQLSIFAKYFRDLSEEVYIIV